MKKYVSYDEGSDSLYIFAKIGREEDVVELVPGVNIELNKSGEVIGIEILRASRFLQEIPKPRTTPQRSSYRVKESGKVYRSRRKSIRNS